MDRKYMTIFGIIAVLVTIYLVTNYSQTKSETINEVSFEGVPTTYSECVRADEKYKEESMLKCTYQITTDKTNNDENSKFLECLRKYPEYKDLSSNCKYVENPGNEIVPTLLECEKNDGSKYRHGVFDDSPCKLTFYNPTYTFPKNFADCKQKSGKVALSYTNFYICSVVIRTSEAYNREIATNIFDECKNLGGYIDGTECDVRFFELPTKEECESARGNWRQLPGGEYTCFI